MVKKTILIDFDGTIHKYSKGWEGLLDIYDPPFDGAKEFLDELAKNYKIVVFTTRATTRDSKKNISEWLNRYKIPFDGITNVKEPASLLIDDRAISFKNYKLLKNQIESFFYDGCKYCTENKVLLQEEFYNGMGLSEIQNVFNVFIDRKHLRLADADDCNCLDHGAKLKINFCPMCGRGL